MRYTSMAALIVASWVEPGMSPAVAGEVFSGQAETGIERVVVTATRSEQMLLEVPAAISVRELDDLRSKGFTYGTDEFRGVPGVFFRRGEGDGEEFPFVSIRGATGNHGNDAFLAMLDGIPFVGPDEEVLLYEIPYPIVNHIEIVRGPVSALYGRGAIGGAINYQTRNPVNNSAELSFSAGQDGYYRGQVLLERQFEQDIGVLASLSYEDFAGWRDNSARDATSAFLKTVIPFNSSSALTAWLSYFERNAQVPSVIPTLADGSVVKVAGGAERFLGHKPTRNNNQGWIAALRYEQQVTDILDIQLTAQARQFDSDVRLNFYDYLEFNPDNNIMGVNGFASVNDASVYFAEALANWQSGRHKLVVGVSAERTTLDEQDRWSGELDPFFSGECGFRFYAILIDYSTGEVLNDQPGNDCFVREQLRTAADTTNQFYGAFFQDEISLSERLTLTVGARYDEFKRNIDFSVIAASPDLQNAEGRSEAVSPKAALAYQLDSGLVYASYGRGFNSNFGPVWQWEPDRYARDEAPTFIDSYELGWKGQTQNKQLSWETALFYLRQTDRRIFIDNPDPEGPPTLATTGQKYSSRGLEAAVRYRPVRSTELLVNYTYLAPEWDELILAGSFGAPDTNFSGNTPQGVPGHIVYAEVSHEFFEQWHGSLSYEWYSDYFVDLSNSIKTGQYSLMNLSVSWFPINNPDLAFDLSVTNVLDEDYFFYFAGSRSAVTNVTPGVPRQIRLGTKVRF